MKRIKLEGLWLILLLTIMIYQLLLFKLTRNILEFAIIILGYEFIKYIIKIIIIKDIKKEARESR